MPAMALLDRDGVYGAPRFHFAASKAGLRAHIGAELSAGAFSYPILVDSRLGYQNLCRIITRMKMRSAKGEGAIEEHELEECASGLVCLTGGKHGPLTVALRRGGVDEGKHSLERLIDIFGRDNVYVEVQ